MLNACRRQRSVHIESQILRNFDVLCSTPVGVKDRFTKSARISGIFPLSAQRLSASKIGSQRSGERRPSLWGCAQRLSASKIGSQWHRLRPGTRYGCSTPVGVKDRFTPLPPSGPGAVSIVLNACRRQRSVHSGWRRRLSAGPGVLNACRRQRSVHPVLPLSVGVILGVLNACRRQRSVH